MQQKNSRWVPSILVILILVLVPVSQTISPNLNFLQLPTASATGGITLNNTATTGTVPSSPYQRTISSFNAGTGSNRLLVVGVDSHGTDAWVNSITFGGVSLTKAKSSFINNDAEFWYLKNPNGTGNITVTMNAAASVVIGAYAFSGVDQTNPIPTTSSSSDTCSPSCTSPTVSLTTQYANSWVLDLPSIWGGVTLGSPTCTQQWDTSVQDGIVGAITGASSSKTTTLPGSVTCSWTPSPNSDYWDDVAIEIKASLAGITLNNVATTGTVPSSPYEKTISSFNAGTGNNRLLVVGVDSGGTDAWVNKITFGGTLLTQAVESFRNNDAEFWYLKNPNGTADIVVTMNAPAAVVVGAYAFSGVDQANPIPTTSNSSDTCSPSCTSPTVSLTTQYANSWVLDLPSIWGGKTLGSPTCTQQWDTDVKDGIVSEITGASSSTIQASSGQATCSWTASPSGDYWDDVAIEVKAASPASTGVIIPLYDVPDSPNTELNSVISSHNAYPSVPMVGIINQNSGKPYTDDPNMASAVTNLQKAGITVIGYVATGYDCTDAPSSCYLNHTANTLSYDELAMKNYSNFYHVNGTFFDEMSNNANSGNLTFYGNLNSYAKNTLGEILTVGNPGTSFGVQDFNGTFDVLNIWENPSLPPVNSYPSWESSFNKNHFSAVAFNIPGTQLNSTYYKNTSQHVGYLYFTNYTTPITWFHVSDYLNSTLGNLTGH